MEYLGEWGGKSVYQPTGKLPTRFPPPPKAQICPAKCTRWFRRVTEDIYEGMCHVCYREQFEGEEDIR